MRKLCLMITIMVAFISCQKENETTPELKLTYMPLSIGNYWVYDLALYNSEGVEQIQAAHDSCFISSDTLINGNTYFVMKGITYFQPNLHILDILRDSSGYLVRPTGEILFSQYNFTDTLLRKAVVSSGDTIYTFTGKMEKPNETIKVPAGNFSCLNFCGTIISFLNKDKYPTPRYLNYYYANGIGKVKETTFYFDSNAAIEWRLAKYHINP